MPRWLSGLDYVLGLLDRWIDSLYCSYFFHIFFNTTTNYYDNAAYSVSLQHNNYITILRHIQCTIVLEARALHPMRTGLPCTQSCSYHKSISCTNANLP